MAQIRMHTCFGERNLDGIKTLLHSLMFFMAFICINNRNTEKDKYIIMQMFTGLFLLFMFNFIECKETNTNQDDKQRQLNWITN